MAGATPRARAAGVAADVGRPIGAERRNEVALTVDEPCQEFFSPTVDLDDGGGVRSADEPQAKTELV